MAAVSPPAILCFVDTNIWLYAFIEAEDRQKQARAKAVIQSNELVVSTQVINEICVNLLKKTQLTEPDIQALILSFYSHYRVVELDQDTLFKASTLRQQYSLSYWDSLIIASALLARCELIYTEDMQHGLQLENKLTIQNPFQSPI
jgi:predicted nucleic acid-binding protein